ncbi:hypothetical protein EDD15DRAFT_2361967 [Pisolithus albus]|nr:hypothetical protein EDD15DRAFT_2361967 [Pisolithus albus]
MVDELLMFPEVLHASVSLHRLSQLPAIPTTSRLASKSPHIPRTYALEHLPTNHRTSLEPFLHLFEPSTTPLKPHTTLEPSIFFISRSRGFAMPTACYFEHNNEMEVYANLAKFLLNNYKQALDTLSNGCATLNQLMDELGPPEETLQMEYWQRLVNLAASRQDLEMILSTWTVITTQNVAPTWKDSSATRKRETTCRHAQENYEKDLKAVQELEGRLGVTCRWVPEDEEWQAATRLVANRKYQRALDNVERLVVSRIFELSKMNQSGTAKALGHQTLEFDEVIEYTFLSDFDLLRDMRQDISTWPEGVICLNVEIRRVITYLVDEDWYLRACEALYQDDNPILAYQISRYRTIRSRFTLLHLHSLEKISCLSGFSGTLTPGVSVSCGLGDSTGVPQRVCMDPVPSSPPVAADDGEDGANEDANEDHASTLEEQYEALQNILSVTTDM